MAHNMYVCVYSNKYILLSLYHSCLSNKTGEINYNALE